MGQTVSANPAGGSATTDNTTTVTSPPGSVAGSPAWGPLPAEDFELPQLLANPGPVPPAAAELPVFAPRELGQPWARQAKPPT